MIYKGPTSSAAVLRQRKTRNPFLRDGGYKTTADLFNSMTQENEQADTAGYFEADRERRLQANPNTVAIKRHILQRAGHDADEAADLANNPDYWRPEFERLGFKRKYEVNPMFAGTVSRRQRNFNRNVDNLEDSLALEDVRDTHRLNREIANEERLADAFPDDDYFDAPRSRSSSSSRSSKAPADTERTKLVAALNRESVIAGGRPLVSAPTDPTDRARSFVGSNMSKELLSAKKRKEVASSYFASDERNLGESEVVLGAAQKALKAAEKMGDPAEIEASRTAMLAAQEDYDLKSTMLGQSGYVLDKAEADAKAVSDRAKLAGLEVNDATVFDAARGRSYFAGPAATRSVSTVDSRRTSGPSRLSPVQLRNVATEIAKLDRAGVIDEESDYFNPQGARAQIIQQYQSGKGYRVEPQFVNGRLQLKPALGANDRFTVQFNTRAEIEDEAARLMQEHPDWTEDDAVLAAAAAIQRGKRRRTMEVIPQDILE